MDFLQTTEKKTRKTKIPIKALCFVVNDVNAMCMCDKRF